MSQTDNGKFCALCSKTVVDFTQLSDTEIIELLENTSGKLCGRLRKQQINRLLEIHQPAHNSQLYKVLAGLLVVGIPVNSIAADISPSQVEIASFHENEPVGESKVVQQEKPRTDTLRNVIRGTILDAHSKEPVYDALVRIKDTRTGRRADFDGNYKLIIPDSLVTEEITLVVKSLDYEEIELKISGNDLPLDLEILMNPLYEGIMLGIVSYDVSPRKVRRMTRKANRTRE
jgi:hypothetical protein